MRGLFVSHRERRLWAWTLAVVAAIFATLAFAGTLGGALPDDATLGAAFGTGALLVLATIVTRGLTTRPSGLEVAVALGVTAAYLLAFVRLASPAERTHLVEYGVLAGLIHEALGERSRHGRSVPVRAVVAIAASCSVGLADECLQAFLPHRVFDPRDILFNVLASVMAVTASEALGWARRSVTRR